ncbi:Amino acid permease [Granulibacter bethesdensis]|nr:Amino acid permease [Granulibacter bethesdensis]
MLPSHGAAGSSHGNSGRRQKGMADKASWLQAALRCRNIALAGGEVSFSTGKERLSRTIGLWRLAMIGVGATIGTGIFVALATAVPKAGPGTILAFVIAGLTAALTALCYAEVASTIPEAGSSYSYTYATMGEVAAFLVGACLLLEYGVAASAIAVGWAQYLNQFLGDTIGLTLPHAMTAAPGSGGYINLPALVLVMLCAGLLSRGVAESSTVNAVLVGVKLLVLLLFAGIALCAFRVQHLTPFMPLGLSGVGSAAATVFFSYVGIDTICTAAEEVKDPGRTLPRAILLCLGIVSLVYMVVAVAAIGAQPWTRFAGQEAGLAVILEQVTGSVWPSMLLCIGALVSIFSVTLVTIYGQTRILFVMSRDGLMPPVFHHVNPGRHVPLFNTWIVAAAVAALAAMFPLDMLANLTSMGTLIAFLTVSAGLIVLRRRHGDLPCCYRVPFYPWVPLLSVVCCLYLIVLLPSVTLAFFAGWIAVALVFYLTYAMHHSVLGRPVKALPLPPSPV